MLILIYYIYCGRGNGARCEKVFQTQSPVTCAVLHPNSKDLIVSDEEGKIYVWDLRTDQNEHIVSIN